VFGLWGATTLVCAGSAALGFAVLGSAPPEMSAVVTAFAAGAILAMLCNTMLPEAFRQERAWTGALTVVGFLAGYVVHSLAG
jgi:ZIP family zinc transporter